MTEPACGRFVEYTDKALVYEAVGTLEKTGIFLDYLVPTNIMIADGQVRFLSVSSAKKYRRDEPGFSPNETIAIQFAKLKRLFDNFDQDRKIYASVVTRDLAQQVRIIPRLPRPRRSLTPPPIPIEMASDLMIRFTLYIPISADDWMRTFGNTGSSKSRRGGGLRRTPLIGPSSPPPEEFHDPYVTNEHEDKPLSDWRLLHSRASRPRVSGN